MSATALTAPVVLDDDVRAPQTGWSRVVAAMRVQTVSFGLAYAWPWGILASAFVINLLIFTVVESEATGSTGGLVSIYIVTAIAGMQQVVQFLPFSLGLGVTRRSFFAAAVLAIVLEALIYGVGLTALLAVEDATDGWGTDMRFFGVSWLVAGNPVSQVFVYAAPFLLFSGMGLLWGAVSKRWGGSGIYVAIVVSILLGGGLLALLGWLDAWDAFGGFFADSPIEVTAGLLPLLAGALSMAAGWAVVRRTSV